MNQSLSQEQNNKNQEATPNERPKEGMGIYIGQDVSMLKRDFGEPQRIDASLYGYQWYIYNLDYSHYIQVGVDNNNQIVTVYAIGDQMNVMPFKIGQPVEEIFNSTDIEMNIDIELNSNSYRFELDEADFNMRPLVRLGDVYVQLYIDKFTGTLSSLRFLNAETLIKQRPYEMVYRGDLLEPVEPSEAIWRIIEEGSEKEIFDITNVLRIRHNLEPLIWDDETSEVALGHSKDMFESKDFSHTSKKFGSLSDRLDAGKIVFKSAGENIAANYTDAPAVVEGWLNSNGHRESLLNDEFTHLGVGVFQKYYTQNFIRKTEE
jgi:uncharacterized protein YkwD